MTELAHQQVKFGPSHIKVELGLILGITCLKGLIEEVHCPLTLDFVVFLVLRVLLDNLVESIEGVSFEVEADLFRGSVVSQGLEALQTLILFDHLGSEFLGHGKRVILEVLDIIVYVGWVLLVGLEHRIEVLVFLLLKLACFFLWTHQIL